MSNDNESRPISLEEARLHLESTVELARPYTDIVMSVADEGRTGIASCVHVELGSVKAAITCEHVVRDRSRFYTAPPRSSSGMMEQTPPAVPPLVLRASDAGLDLAAFDGRQLDLSAAKKTRYLLDDSAWVTPEKLQKEIGTSACILGFWAEQTRGHQYDDGAVFMDAVLYSGLGPLQAVQQRLIVADIAEREIVLRSQKIARMADVQPTGGVRDLRGISGSGLWIRSKTGPLDAGDGRATLIGIVSGREDGDDQNEHLIRATPVWSVREWLARVG